MADNIDDRFLHDLLDRDGKLNIPLSWKEAVLLDYLLTASAINEEVLHFLDASRHIRDEVGYVLLGHRDYILLSQEDTDLLRKLVSPIFPMGGEQVGERLKVKLHGALLGHPAPPAPEKTIERSQEV
jgi:hypothetical protein